jgi:hypothetical protein
MSFEKIKKSLKNKTILWKIIALFSVILFFSVLITLPIKLILNYPVHGEILSLSSKARNNNSVGQCNGCVRRAVDGVYVKPEEANYPAVAVMIDNHPDARPQSGIDKASLVYEAEVEGNYTRLMAVFASLYNVKEIGPVRSARPYFIDWAEELNSIYVHCGGSPEALADLAQDNILDLNEFYNGQYFWRGQAKNAPHNIFISSENINKFLEDRKIFSGNNIARNFKDDSPISKASSSAAIKINYNIAEFKVEWVYDAGNNSYVRYLGGKPELTADGNKITAKNILIQTVPATVVDAELRLKMNTVGSGSAVLCQDGICQKGKWSKSQLGSTTKFTYSNGQEMRFNAGPTWIEIVRPEIKIEY